MLEQASSVMEHDLSMLSQASQAFAVCNGLTMAQRKPLHADPNLLGVCHIPFTLFPTKFPTDCFRLAWELGPLFNRLVDRISRDVHFVETSLARVAEADDFTKRLLDIFKQVHLEGISQSFSLGIHRSDYMLNCCPNGGFEIQQVEINTISSSFAALSTLTNRMHKFLLERFPDIFSMYSSHQISASLQTSNSIETVPRALALAHTTFVKQQNLTADSSKVFILFVVQTGERNIADQKHLEHTLWGDYRIGVLRRDLLSVIQQAQIDPNTKALKIDGKIISVAYFRAGYTPNDYPSEREWEARLLIERATCIKCPNIGYHLAGTKKIQQVFSEPGVLERYLEPEECKTMRQCFAGMYSLDPDSSRGEEYNKRIEEAIQQAIANRDDFVLKPQREGGGNLIYGDKLHEVLSYCTAEDRKQYVLMQRIRPPPVETCILRDAQITIGKAVSEIGIYGLFLGDGQHSLLNESGGYLLRTKLETTLDGGVVAGAAVMDSVFLV